MESLTLIKIRNPFDRATRDVTPVPLRHGQTLLDLRNEQFPRDVPVIVSVNGKALTEPELAITVPREGDEILFAPEVRGGDNGILRTVLMIAVSVAAMYLFGPGGVVLNGGLWGSLAMAGTVALGGYLINSILPPTLPVQVSNDLTKSQVYSWSPQTIQAQGVPVPTIYGTNKMYGNVISTYQNWNGEKNNLAVLLALGLGPLANIYDPEINDQSADPAMFSGLDFQSTLGRLVQPILPNFDEVKTETAVNVIVTSAGGAYTYNMPGDGTYDYIEIDIAFPSGLWAQNQQTGNIDAYTVQYKVEIRQSGGSWVNLTKSYSMNPMSYYTGAGYWSAGYLIHDTHAISLGYVNTYSYLNTADLSNKARVWYEVLAGSANKSDHSEGELYQAADGAGSPDIVWRWIWYGSYVTTAKNDYEWAIGYSLAPVHMPIRTPRLTPGAYDIRVTKITADNGSVTVGDDLSLYLVRRVSSDKYSYPRLALVAVSALATDKLSGTFRFSCMTDGKLVRVYNGTSWSVAANNNPAWVCYDILTQPVFNDDDSVARYDGIDPSRLDTAAFEAWADWCDELVNGAKRITFNGVFDSDTTMWDAALRICQVGRAVLFQRGTTYTVAVDKADTAVQLFSVGNIEKDSFQLSYLPMDGRASEIEVEFVNEENGYNRSTFTVYNSAMLGSPVSAKLSLFGITKPKEAYRAALYQLLCNQYITRQVKFSADVDAIACTLGDVIKVQHDVPEWGEGGRLISAASSSVTLDKTVTIEAGKTYIILVKTSDDTVQTGIVTTGAGDHTMLTISGTFSPVPEKLDLWVFGEQNLAVREYRVMNISRDGDLKMSIEAAEYNEAVYACDSGAEIVPTGNYEPPTIPDTMPATATGLTLTQTVYDANDLSYVPKVMVTYEVDPDTADLWQSGHVFYAIDRGSGYSWISAGYDYSKGAGFLIDLGTTLAPGDTVHVMVVAVSTAGQEDRKELSPQETIIISASGTLPTPTGLALEIGGTVWNGLKFAVVWTPMGSGDLDPSYVNNEIRISANGHVEFFYTKNNRWEYVYGDGAAAGLDSFMVGGHGTVDIWVRRTSPIAAASGWATLRITNAAPTNPFNLAAIGVIRGAQFNWDANTEADFKKYQVRTRITSGGTWSGWFDVVDTSYQRILSDAEITAYGTTPDIYIEVKALDLYGNASTAASTYVAALTVTVTPDTTPPDTPTGLSLSTGVSQGPDGSEYSWIRAQWTANSESDLAYYEYRIKETGGNYVYGQVGTNDTGPMRVRANVVHYVGIRAVDSSGNKSNWTTDSSTTSSKDTTAPGTVAGVSASGGIQYILVTWTANSEADIDHYDVYRNTTNNSGTATNIASVKTSYFIDGNRTGGQIYYYWIKAVDRSGNASAAFSTVASATPRNVQTNDVEVIAANKILIDGTVYLTDWRKSGDLTKIDGGKISTRTITTESLEAIALSRTGSLVKNGSITSGDNTNFSSCVYIGTDGHSAYGCLEKTSSATVESDAFISVDTSRTYNMSIALKSVGAGGLSTAYVGVSCYDRDKNFIQYYQAVHYSNTETTLAADLTNGATTLTLTSGANWKTSGDPAVNRFAGMSTEGYPDYTYARTSLAYASISGNVVTLSAAYSGPTILAGTKIANYYAGSNYNYFVTGPTSIPASWTKYTGSINPLPVGQAYSGENSYFRPGTAFIKPLILANYYQGATYSLRMDDIYITLDSDFADIINSGSTKITGGKILISGSTTLNDWRHGSDLTKIDGGNLYANSVAANKVVIGSRGLSIQGIEISAQNPTANTLYWGAGVISYIKDDGTTADVSISSSSQLWSSGTLYLYWVKDATTLSTTTARATAFGANNVVLATYRGGTDLVVDKGRTIIDGSDIVTETITAAALVKTAAIITASAQIDNAIINNAHINDLSVSKLTAGTMTSKAITLAVSNGDAKIQAGKTDFGDSTAGFILGIDYSASKTKFEIGDASKYLKWDGSSLTLRGTLNADDLLAGTITGLTHQTATSGQRIVIDGSANEQYFYGNRGDGTIEQLASIGIKALGSDDIIGFFGSSTSGNSKTGIAGLSYDGKGVIGQSINSFGVIGFSKYSYGVLAEGDATNFKAPIRLFPSYSSSAPTHSADLGALWVTSNGILYINTSSPSPGTTWTKVGAQ